MKKLDARARTTEIDDVSERLLVLYRKETALQEEAFLKSTFAEIETLSHEITEAIKRDVSLSKQEEADLRRDNLVRSLNAALLGYCALPIPQLKENGEKLFAVFSKYGVKITKEAYAVESSLIESLLKDLSAPELEPAIASLTGVGEIISQLRTAQTSFTQIRTEYEKAVSEQKDAPSASSLKKPLLNAINGKLIPYLIAMKIANPAQYSSLANAVAQAIDATNIAIKRRNNNKNQTPNE
ncbi:hypothetical protein CGC58_10320 [Capnocytophaga stomatis]|uniref:Uncharacterized protein n=1 Tax=Capnocytophaga stomatis TaxID=1848904 RepID=A0A250G170_9FLAO|nr:DUF6261 family protein [Capnocytophaga stomatis]ATA90078.1 hypothetical protein CGC58_10320 [Capnocytophaga stomatis]